MIYNFLPDADWVGGFGGSGEGNGETHSHTNKTVLDATTASYTTEDKTKLTNLVQFRVVKLTQVQYDALTIEEKNLDTVLYVIEG